MPFAAAVAPEAVGLSSEDLRMAFARFKAATSPSGQPLSGGVMAVSRRGQPCFVESFGSMDEFGGGPMSADCVFNIASMTKSVTSVATMMLIEEGKLSLDDPVSRWFPSLAKDKFRVASPQGGTVPCEREILVRHLMTHTSGLTYGLMFQRPEGDPLQQAEETCLEFGIVPLQAEDFAKCTLAFQPGTRFRYSNAPHLLARVLEAASGLALEELFRAKIFSPLGMSRTSYTVSSQDMPFLAKPQMGTAKRAEGKIGFPELLAVCFERDAGASGPGRLSPFPGPPGRSVVTGDAGLHSTPEDWHRFMEMLLGKGKGLMSEETFRTLVTPATPVLDDPSFNTNCTDRRGSGGQFLCGLESPLGQGGLAHSLLGETAVGPNVLGMRPGAFGWEGLVSTKYVVDPSEELAVSLWANVVPCWRYALKQEVMPLVYRALRPPSVPHASCFREPPRLAKL